MYDQIVDEVCTGIWAIFNKPNYQITFNLITNGQFGYILRIVSFSIHPPHDLTNFTRSYDKLLKYITGVKAYLDVSLGWATGVHDLRHSRRSRKTSTRSRRSRQMSWKYQQRFTRHTARCKIAAVSYSLEQRTPRHTQDTNWWALLFVWMQNDRFFGRTCPAHASLSGILSRNSSGV